MLEGVTVSRNRMMNPFKFRRLAVSAVQELTPQLTRVTLTGDMSEFVSRGPADPVKVFFPGPDGVLNAPYIGEDGKLVRDPDVEYISRDYTPLNWTETTLDLDFVIHGDEGPLSPDPLPPGADVEWVLGDFEPEPYVRERDVSTGTGFIWAAGESTSLIGVRRYLRRELGLPKQQVDVDGYWRKGVADADHHAPIDPDDPED